MTEEISQRELRNDSGRIMRDIDAGKSFVVTRRGQPVAELRPLRRQRFVSRELFLELFRDAPSIDLGRFRDDLDSIADQNVELRV